MELNALDRAVLAYVADGLPLTPRPYLALAEATGLDEPSVVARVQALKRAGIIRRLGLVVRHRELGYRANAMIAWDVAPTIVDEIGARMARHDFVSLCYRRLPHPPQWPYNLFVMIHGRDRAEVERSIDRLQRDCGVDAPRVVLFSGRRFKQRGARFASEPTSPLREHHAWTSATAGS